ncbi:MAG: DUF2064 domain-containing protein [Vicinamibacterales bacterium]
MNPSSGRDRAPTSAPAVAMLARSPFAAGKTRLTAGLDDSDALALRTAVWLDTTAAALSTGWPLHLFLDPAGDLGRARAAVHEDAAVAAVASRVHWHPQVQGDLGARMADALTTTLAAGHDLAVLVGSDIPDLPPEALESARRALAPRPRGAAAAFGPSADGGFYLVAAADAAPLAAAFSGLAWSHPRVLADVCARLAAGGCDVVTVTPWRDLDLPEDLAALLARADGRAPRTRRALAGLRLYNGGL